ncbi:MAG: DUF4169 family protein [Pseudomonadota bacterium]
MTGSPINLNKVRKARAHASEKARAQANTVAFGRSKAQKAADGLEVARLRRDLDGKALKLPEDTTATGDKKP